jgi:hypothetical protein
MNLKKLTKKALEALGRENGIELDRRLSKGKLVEQLEEVLETKEPTSLVELKEEAVEEISNSPVGLSFKEADGFSFKVLHDGDSILEFSDRTAAAAIIEGENGIDGFIKKCPERGCFVIVS